EAPRRARERVDEQEPRNERRERKHGVRHTAGGQVSELAEHDREHRRLEQRLQDHPRRPDRRLLVTDLHISPDEEVQELAVLPQLTEIERCPTSAGTENGDAAATEIDVMDCAHDAPTIPTPSGVATAHSSPQRWTSSCIRSPARAKIG